MNKELEELEELLFFEENIEIAAEMMKHQKSDLVLEVHKCGKTPEDLPPVMEESLEKSF